MAHTLNYESPRRTPRSPILLLISEVSFIFAAIAFVPLHVFLGRNVLIGYFSLIVFTVGTVTGWMAAMERSKARPFSFLITACNALATIAVICYLVYYWDVLEPLTMLGE